MKNQQNNVIPLEFIVIEPKHNSTALVPVTQPPQTITRPTRQPLRGSQLSQVLVPPAGPIFKQLDLDKIKHVGLTGWVVEASPEPSSVNWASVPAIILKSILGECGGVVGLPTSYIVPLPRFLGRVLTLAFLLAQPPVPPNRSKPPVPPNRSKPPNNNDWDPPIPFPLGGLLTQDQLTDWGRAIARFLRGGTGEALIGAAYQACQAMALNGQATKAEAGYFAIEAMALATGTWRYSPDNWRLAQVGAQATTAGIERSSVPKIAFRALTVIE